MNELAGCREWLSLGPCRTLSSWVPSAGWQSPSPAIEETTISSSIDWNNLTLKGALVYALQLECLQDIGRSSWSTSLVLFVGSSNTECVPTARLRTHITLGWLSGLLSDQRRQQERWWMQNIYPLNELLLLVSSPNGSAPTKPTLFSNCKRAEDANDLCPATLNPNRRLCVIFVEFNPSL